MAEYFNYFGFVMFSKIKAVVVDALIQDDPVQALQLMLGAMRQRQQANYKF